MQTNKKARLVSLGLLAYAGVLHGLETVPVDQEIATTALEAVIEVELVFENGFSWSFCGNWVSEDGNAIVPLQAMAYSLPPQFRNGAGTELKFVRVLAINRVAELALVQLKPRPKRWLKLAGGDSPIGETIALLWRNLGKEGIHQGPILVRRPALDAGAKSTALFQSLGLNLGPFADVRGPVGSPVINREGHLTGVFTRSGGVAYRHSEGVQRLPGGAQCHLNWFNRPRSSSNPDPDGFDQSQAWKPEEIPLGDGRILVLDDT